MSSLECWVEAKVFQKHCAQLNEAVVFPDVFGQHLVQCEFATQTEISNVVNTLGVSDYKKTSQLLQIVGSRIRTATSRESAKNLFDQLVLIFADRLGRVDIAKALITTYKSKDPMYISPLEPVSDSTSSSPAGTHLQPSALPLEASFAGGYTSSAVRDNSYLVPPHMAVQLQNWRGGPLNHSGTSVDHLPLNRPVVPPLSHQGSVSPPQPKRRKYDLVLGQVPLSTAMIQDVDRWREKLIDFYLLQEKSTDAWPPLKVVRFVQLALIKQDITNRHIGLHTIKEDIDAVYGEKTSVEFDCLFENFEHRSLVLIEGRPGCGKTTLMVKVSCDWARGRILQKKLVLFVRLRHLRKDSEVYLHDLLKVACTAFSKDEILSISSYIEGRLGEDVVFVLDGFDEYSPGGSSENFISKLILKEIYSKSVVIVSSRPAATQYFRQEATKWIEVVGFMKEQVTEYIDTYFEDKKDLAKQLNKHLEQHPNLWNMCYLPLHCAMLVFLYAEEEFLPETETDFYTHFTLSTLVRGIRKLSKDRDTPFQLSSYKDLPHEEKQIFEKVCELAFQATITSQQVFKRSDLDKISFQFKEKSDVNSLGLVVIDRYFVRYGLDETYSFIHLTFQEYLAAVHLASFGEPKLCFTITDILQNHRLVPSLQSSLGQTQQTSTISTLSISVVH